MWFDAHNHLQDPRLPPLDASMVDELRASGVSGAVVNGTCPDDWPKVADLSRRFPDFIRPAFGLHPWKVKSAAPGWDTVLRNYLTEFPSAHLGEIGLDRWLPGYDIETQKAAVLIQWNIAAETNRAITFHCLRAWDDWFALWPELPDRAGRILVHGFTASPEIASQLVKRGCYLGFGGYVMHDRKSAARVVFREIPEDHLLVETDAPDMAGPQELRRFHLPDGKLNHPGNLVAHAEALAALRGRSPEELAKAIGRNMRDWLDG